MSNSSLSVCMIVQNEEKYIQKCLDSIQDVADQIVVIDTGSEDDTIPLVKEYDTDLYHYDWENDFSEARNYSLREASGEWILQIDADEVLEKSEGLTSLLNNSGNDGYLVKIRNINSSQGFVKYSEDKQIRLFRNKQEYKYRNKIHEQIAPSIQNSGGKVTGSNLRIDHYGYIDKGEDKARRNFSIMKEEVKANPRDPYLNFKLGENYKALDNYEKSQEYLQKSIKLENFNSLPSELRSTALMRLAQVELQLDNYQEAANNATKSLEIKSENEIARFILAVSYIYLGKIQESAQIIQKLNQKSEVLDKSTLKEFSILIDKLQKAE